jgi:hypothetical protein
MKVTVAVMRPDHGDVDCSFGFDLPVLPREGDCIFIDRPGQPKGESLIVRRTCWLLEFLADADLGDGMVEMLPNGEFPPAPCPGVFKRLTVECERMADAG